MSKIDTSQIYSSGIIKQGEEIVENAEGSMKFKNNRHLPGWLVITNKRLIFLYKKGLFSKGVNVGLTNSLDDILSVSVTGLISKRLNVNVLEKQTEKGHNIIDNKEFLYIKNVELFSEKLVAAKNRFIDEKTIEAKRVIIEEGNKDDASEILKKRLARGEITLEEFHRKIQRT